MGVHLRDGRAVAAAMREDARWLDDMANAADDNGDLAQALDYRRRAEGARRAAAEIERAMAAP